MTEEVEVLWDSSSDNLYIWDGENWINVSDTIEKMVKDKDKPCMRKNRFQALIEEE
jgi:hypothetical protein